MEAVKIYARETQNQAMNRRDDYEQNFSQEEEEGSKYDNYKLWQHNTKQQGSFGA